MWSFSGLKSSNEKDCEYSHKAPSTGNSDISSAKVVRGLRNLLENSEHIN